MDLRHHAPHGLAQQRRRGHGGGTAAQLIVDGFVEIETQDLLGLFWGKLAVGGQTPQIEQRRIEPGVLPVQEPQSVPVIHKVGCKQVVVSKYDLDWTDGGLESVGAGEKILEEGSLPAVAFAQRVRV